MKDLKEKDLKLKEKELEASPSTEDDSELSAEELDGVSGGSFKDWLIDRNNGPFSQKE